MVNDVAVDASGNVYIVGNTASANFPTASPIDGTLTGTGDVFVAKLPPPCTALTFSTYLGGSGALGEIPRGIALDASNNVYVAGRTASTDFPTASPFQAAHGGGSFDGFVTKINAAGSALTYSTYLGGAASDDIQGMVVDSSNNAYVVGDTSSANFPTTGAVLDTVLGGASDAFVSKLNAAGSALTYSTYLGGTGFENAGGMALDSSGNVYVTGKTVSSDFPLVNAFDSTIAGDEAYIAKLNSTGTALTYSTYLGGANDESGKVIAIDSSGNIYVAGNTNSTDFPTVEPLFSSFFGVSDHLFIARFSADGSKLLFSTYLGGDNSDTVADIALDSSGNVYIVGNTTGSGFPTVNAFDSIQGATGQDGFIAKINLDPNSFQVVSPYWQTSPGIYTFVTVGHTSLSGMNGVIGVVMTALNQDASQQGTLEFTVSAGNVQRVFITTTNFLFGPTTNPNDRFLITDTTASRAGMLGFASSVSSPEFIQGGAGNPGSGFADIRALSFWGAIVILNSSTGFAMEFIGDMQDSRAFSSANFSGVN